MCIFVCKMHLHFPDSKHLRGFVCHEIFGNFFVIRKFLAYTPPTIHASYGPAANIHAWHGRIRVKLKKSLEHKYTMAWTRPRQVKKLIGT